LQDINASRAKKFSDSCISCNVLSQVPEIEMSECVDPCTPADCVVISREDVPESMG
jgi:hypothetical protein